MEKEMPWGGIAIIFCGWILVSASLYRLQWFSVVKRPVNSGYPLGPEYYPTASSALKVLAAILFVLGILIVGSHLLKRGRNETLVGITGLIGILTISVQLRTFGPVLGAGRTIDYITMYLLYDVSVAGLIESLILLLNGRRRTSGVLLSATGSLISAITLGYLFYVTGGDGMWQESLSIAIGSVIMFGTGVLLLIGGVLLTKPFDISGTKWLKAGSNNPR